ncbi:MAG TPA: glycosyltransferase family 2 protein [Ktedonobacteraceae bacterium]|nr:glycosyltransferase family 2 protein [Ktedonobacteraceae bacterium]
MSMIQLLRLLLLAAEVVIAAPILYLIVLSLTAIVATQKRKAAGTRPSAKETPRYNFAILVPAHNEELLLGNLLTSLARLAYPKDRYTVYVIADNCTDTTAELARRFDGVSVYERCDSARRGKGYALNWMLQKIAASPSTYDAYVIIDADSETEPAFLQHMARELARGAEALQGRWTVLNASASPGSALRWIAVALHAHVRPLARTYLGASSTLTGNGMCFSSGLLQRHPWQAYSLAEDYEYYLSLVRQGERVRYVPEAIIYSIMPTTFAAMRTQDIRWETLGNGNTTWQIAIDLLKATLQRRTWACFEAMLELLTPPLSFLAGSSLLALVLSALLSFPPALLLSFAFIAGLAFYVSTVFLLLRPPVTVYRSLLYAPAFMLWKLWVLLVLKHSKKHTAEWIRTSRTG